MSVRDDLKASYDELTPLFEEMQNASDRVAAISCAAWVDDSLGAVLSKCFVEMGADWNNRIFNNATAPLNSLSSKITLGYAMGLFGPLTCADLNIIRSVRNDFAHRAAPISFSEAEIAEKCKKLTSPFRMSAGITGAIPTTPPPEPKRLYIRASQRISFDLIGWSRANQPPRPSFPADILP